MQTDTFLEKCPKNEQVNYFFKTQILIDWKEYLRRFKIVAVFLNNCPIRVEFESSYYY